MEIDRTQRSIGILGAACVHKVRGETRETCERGVKTEHAEGTWRAQESEGPMVPAKRVTTVEGRGPGSGCFPRSGRAGDWHEPNSPNKTRRAAREALHEGQSGADVPVLRSVRQDPSVGCPDGGAQAGEDEQGRSRSGRANLREGGGVRGGTVAQGPATRVAGEDVSAPASPEGADTEARRWGEGRPRSSTRISRSTSTPSLMPS